MPPYLVTLEVLQRLLDQLLLLDDVVSVDEGVVDDVADDRGEHHPLHHRSEGAGIHLGSLRPDHVCEGSSIGSGVNHCAEER